jgi:preprotein translocase SecE subunit
MAENPTKVRRIKAQEAEIVKRPKRPKQSKKLKDQKTKPKAKRPMPRWLQAVGRALNKVFGPAGRYVKGSWEELRQTRWPNRRATWGLTVAVILFSIFFAALILSFDNLFEWILETILNMKGSN